MSRPEDLFRATLIGMLTVTYTAVLAQLVAPIPAWAWHAPIVASWAITIAMGIYLAIRYPPRKDDDWPGWDDPDDDPEDPSPQTPDTSSARTPELVA